MKPNKNVVQGEVRNVSIIKTKSKNMTMSYVKKCFIKQQEHNKDYYAVHFIPIHAQK
jgi:hypothetical protein